MLLRTKTSSKAFNQAAATGLALGLALSLSGCAAGAKSGTPTASAAAKSSYGDVTGTGETVGAANGVYETITVSKDSALNIFNEGKGNPANLEAAGWKQDDGVAGQKLAADFMVKEFLDSLALEGGPSEFEAWRQTEGTKYLSAAASESASAPEAQGVILSNAKGKTLIPTLIHDGKPRVKNVDLKVAGFGNYNEGHGIVFSFDFTADYRVSDADAAAYAGTQFTSQSGEEFIKSDKAKPQLKDGTGENAYRAKGFANVIVDKDETGAMKIVGVTSKADFNTDDFTF